MTAAIEELPRGAHWTVDRARGASGGAGATRTTASTRPRSRGSRASLRRALGDPPARQIEVVDARVASSCRRRASPLPAAIAASSTDRRSARPARPRLRQGLRRPDAGRSAATSPNPPDWVAYPRDEADISAVLAFAEAEGIAVIPYGGGSSVVGGVEPPARDSLPRASSPRPPPPRSDRRRRPRVASRGGRGWHLRAGPGGRAQAARPHPPPLPAELRVLDRRRLDRDAGERPLRDGTDPDRPARRRRPDGDAARRHRHVGARATSGAGPSAGGL